MIEKALNTKDLLASWSEELSTDEAETITGGFHFKLSLLITCVVAGAFAGAIISPLATYLERQSIKRMCLPTADMEARLAQWTYCKGAGKTAMLGAFFGISPWLIIQKKAYEKSNFVKKKEEVNIRLHNKRKPKRHPRSR